VIWTEQVHMAPKSGGRLIVGATVEEVGFDANVTVGGLFALLDAARRALPSVEDVAVEAVWSGFRPTSEDDAPILGAAGLPGLLLAVGLLATLGQTSMTRAYKRGNTLLTANLQYTGIVFASGWGMLLWNDHLNALSWLGMALIIGSGIVTTVMRARQSGAEHPTPQTAVSGPEAEVHPEV
jgi:formate-dependent nitrite reductase membrane component NrfD